MIVNYNCKIPRTVGGILFSSLFTSQGPSSLVSYHGYRTNHWVTRECYRGNQIPGTTIQITRHVMVAVGAARFLLVRLSLIFLIHNSQNPTSIYQTSIKGPSGECNIIQLYTMIYVDMYADKL